MRVANELSEGLNVSDVGKNFIADFYAYAFVGILVDWVKKDMKESTEILTDRIKDIVDEGSLLRALARYGSP